MNRVQALQVLVDGQSKPQHRRLLLHRLSLAPWVWPADNALAEQVEQFVGSRPNCEPGDALLVSVDDDVGASCWRLRVGDETSEVTWGTSAMTSWEDAHVAVARTAAIRRRFLSRTRRVEPTMAKVSSWVVPGAEPTVVKGMLDGASYGLGFFLSVASYACDVPLKPDFVALATIDRRGRTGEVHGLRHKLAAVWSTCPAVQRVLVCKVQQREVTHLLEELQATDLEVIGVSSGAEALELALDGRVTDGLARVTDADERADWVQAAFMLALDGHHAISHWTSIANAIDHARQLWDAELADDQKKTLDFCVAVARRHDSGLEPALPAPKWALPLPQQLRVEVLAHYVQDAHDRGSQLPQELADEVSLQLERAVGDGTVQCKLRGAWGRLLALTQPRSALVHQETAVRQLFALHAVQQVSRPLCELYRLSGALGDHEAFERAETLYRRLMSLGGAGANDQPYLALSRSVATLRIAQGGYARKDNKDALRALEQLARDASVPSHVSLSAWRWVATLADGDRRDYAHDELAARKGHKAEAFAALARLSSGEGRAGDIDAVEAMSPGPVRRLQQAFGETALAAALVRWFPY